MEAAVPESHIRALQIGAAALYGTVTIAAGFLFFTGSLQLAVYGLAVGVSVTMYGIIGRVIRDIRSVLDRYWLFNWAWILVWPPTLLAEFYTYEVTGAGIHSDILIIGTAGWTVFMCLYTHRLYTMARDRENQ